MGFLDLRPVTDAAVSARLGDDTLRIAYGGRGTFGSEYRPMSDELFAAERLGPGGVTIGVKLPAFKSMVGDLWPECDRFTRQNGALTLTDAGSAGANFLDGSLTRAAYDREFWLDGKHVTIMYSAFAGGDFHVYINDQPVTADPQKITATGAFLMDIPFAEEGLYKIRITTANCDILQILSEKTESVYPAKKRFNLGILADSWGQGSTGYLAGAIPHWVGHATGFAIWRNCQGGTGYHNVTVGGSDFTPFGSPSRIAALAKQSLDAILIYGSFNDGDQAAATLHADATACFAAIEKAMPGIPVVVAGWQPYYNGDANADSNSEGVRTAALAAPNVRGYIDWRGKIGDREDHKWITGTGTIGTPKGDGTGDVLIYSPSDPHPNLRANKMLGRRLADAMAPMSL